MMRSESDIRHPVTAARALGARVGRLLALEEVARYGRQWAEERMGEKGEGTESTQRREGAERERE